MNSGQLRKQHLQSFNKLTLTQRLNWAFSQHRFFTQFMDASAKKLNKNLRRYGKKYFAGTNLE